LGANVILKYLGERDNVPNQVKAAISISVPCDLHGSCKELHKIKNKLFHDRFLKDLVVHLKAKQKNFPEFLSVEDVNTIKTLKDFDELYTSKAHGFKDALDYYERSSSLRFLHNIKTPTLIINALNDSFLSAECYPIKDAKINKNIYLEMPQYGGHAGFIDKNNVYYNEKRALEFINETIS
jgi:predicted alpha/beta-fold hydrolase